jgi:hypothetical protein
MRARNGVARHGTPGGELDFYWAIVGTSTWNPEQISGGVGLPLP